MTSLLYTVRDLKNFPRSRCWKQWYTSIPVFTLSLVLIFNSSWKSSFQQELIDTESLRSWDSSLDLKGLCDDFVTLWRLWCCLKLLGFPFRLPLLSTIRFSAFLLFFALQPWLEDRFIFRKWIGIVLPYIVGRSFLIYDALNFFIVFI